MVVVKQVDQIEVFWNENGSITMKQSDPLGEENLIAFDVEHIPSIIEALQAMQKEEPNDA